MDLDALKEFLAEPNHGGWGIGGMEALTLEPGHVIARREVTADLANFGKTLHGGAAATLVDVAGSLALITGDREGRFGVTTDLNASWLAPAPVGEWIQIEARVLKIGRTMGYVAVDIRRESDGVLAVQGRMTKHMGAPPA
jgi:acyl-coenzyme A thioesterase 13